MQETVYTDRSGEIRKLTEVFNVPQDDTRESVMRKRYEAALKKVFADGGKLLSITQKKIGRNDPCPCGSGRKFKRCHEAKMNVELATGGH